MFCHHTQKQNAPHVFLFLFLPVPIGSHICLPSRLYMRLEEDMAPFMFEVKKKKKNYTCTLLHAQQLTSPLCFFFHAIQIR